MSHFRKDNDDFDIMSILLDNGMVAELKEYDRYRKRRLSLNCEVCQSVVDDLVNAILEYNAEDKGKPIEEREPIILYIASNGGEVTPGMELVDVIENSDTPVYTVTLGYAYSMAVYIGIAGKKRYAMPNASFLIHEGDIYNYNSYSKAKDTMVFRNETEERTWNQILSKTKITREDLEQRSRNEWYLFADQAKECGIIDKIVGVDCKMDEII